MKNPIERKMVSYIICHSNRTNDQEEAKQISNGYFHTWGYEVIRLGDNAFANTYAIVEDRKTGQIHQVKPDRVTFWSQEQIIQDYINPAK